MAAWLIIADDLTGACDSGAAFASRGYSTQVAIQAGADIRDAAVQVLVTESRALPADQAVQVVTQTARLIPGLDQACVYQKIDSTLRGHPGAEFAALLRATGAERALVCPAFPEQGRVVQAGQVLVHGVPLQDTPFAGDAPIVDLARMFDIGPGSRALHLADLRRGVDWLAGRMAEPGVYIADAQSAADLGLLAQAAQQAGIRLYCGSAGLARALAAQMTPGSMTAGSAEMPRRNGPLPISGPLMAVAGSRSPATLSQVAALALQGWEVVYLSEEDISSQDSPVPLVFRIANRLRDGIPVAVSVERLATVPGGEQRITDRLGDLAAAVVARAPVRGLILTGGATARAVLLGLGCLAVELRGETQPGVVCSVLRGGDWEGLPLITKAGGFGGPDALVHAASFFTSEA